MTSEIFAVMLDYIGPFIMTASVIGGIVGFAIGFHMGMKENKE